MNKERNISTAQRLLNIPEQVWIDNYFKGGKDRHNQYTEMECLLLDIPYPSIKDPKPNHWLQLYMQTLRSHRQALHKAEEKEDDCSLDVIMAIEWLKSRLSATEWARSNNAYYGHSNNTRTHG